MEKSCQVIEILFWIGIGIVFYTYLGYGIVLYLMVKIKELFVKPRLPRLPETLPEATLLIAAYNEEAIVASKMVNCRQLDYPADKLRLVWITDGSNDNTNERLKEYPEVTVLYQPRRQGKTAALNRAIPYVKTPYVIFTDATLMAIAEARPGDERQLLSIAGVGRSKADKYSEAVFAILGSVVPAGQKLGQHVAKSGGDV